MSEFTRDMIFGSNKIESENDSKIKIDFSIDKTTQDILNLKKQTCMNIIEIGEKLILAKDSIEHGEFIKWLEDKVYFSKRTAQRFMKIAQEFSETTEMSFLGQQKLYLLAGLEIEERQEIIENNDIEKISTKELEHIVKQNKNNIPKFTGKIKKVTLKKYRDRFQTDEEFNVLIDNLLEEYFNNT